MWERQADGATRHRIVLVPEGYDDERGGTGQFLLLEPEMTMLKQAAVLTKLRVNALIDELNHAGLIDDETRDRINAKPSVLPFNQMRVFDHAVNVGDHFD